MIFRARTVVTMDGPPIENGAVAVRGNIIQAVGKFDEVARLYAGMPVDLGEQVLLPGLINAHCHLDYTIMRHSIGPQNSFSEWIKRINAMKRSLDEEDYLSSIAHGFAELKRWGTTTVLNMEAFPELMVKLPPPPIRTWWFYEMIDVRQRIATEELVAGAFFFFQQRPEWLGGFGLNPHAPYTASRELYRLANDCARIVGMPLTTHVAESAEEDQMFREATGGLYEFMASLGRDMSDCGHGSPLAHLLRHDLMGEDWIVAHLNELDDEDLRLLGSTNLHVVHCPLSHRFFQHRPFQFKRLCEIGVNICIGTDSLASNESLNLFAEMQAALKSEPNLRAGELLATVTVNAARALKKENALGRIAPGACADLIALPFADSVPAVYDTIVHNKRPVAWMMVDGQISE